MSPSTWLRVCDDVPSHTCGTLGKFLNLSVVQTPLLVLDLREDWETVNGQGTFPLLASLVPTEYLERKG